MVFVNFVGKFIGLLENINTYELVVTQIVSCLYQNEVAMERLNCC